MRAFRLVLALLLAFSAGAAAADFQGCTKDERVIIKRAIGDAKGLAVFAAAAIADNEIYARWFGKYTPAQAEIVRHNLKSIAGAIRSGAVTAQCDPVRGDACEIDFYAFVYEDEPYLIHFCPRFFNQPAMSALRPGGLFSNNGTRAGTVIHEISHFRVIGRTLDTCYARDVCEEMAQDDAAAAIGNADSYQYFAEDVVHFSDRASTEAAGNP